MPLYCARRSSQELESGRTRTITPTPPASAPVRGGTLISSGRSEPRSFNRIASQNYTTELFTVLTQAKLLRINRATGELEARLAERWTSAPDGMSHTLTLREGIKWSDGTPFTVADVLFSFEATYAEGSVLASAAMVAGKPLAASSPDPRTVVVTFPQPFAPGLRLLDNLVIFPKHKLEAPLRAGKLMAAWSPATPPSEIVGLGPFRLARYEPGQRLVFERNPNYWNKDERGEQLPYLDSVVIEILPNQDAEIVRFQSGATDMMQEGLRATDVAQFRALEQQQKLQLLDLGVARDAPPMIFNMRGSRWEKDPRAPWFTRKEFRQALSHAVDREAYANTVYLGEAVPVHGPVTPGNREWFWPDIPRYRYSLESARKLLEGLGLRNRDGDEWLEDEKGTEARFTLEVFGGAREIERGAEVFRDDVRKAGIAVDVVKLESNTVIQHVTSGDFEVAFAPFQLTDPDPAVSQDFWLSSGASHMWNIEQKTPATDWEREIDALIHKQSITFDMAERKKLFIEAQRLFAENLPMLHFAAPRIYFAVSPRVTHMTPMLQRPQVLWNAERIALKPGAGPS